MPEKGTARRGGRSKGRYEEKITNEKRVKQGRTTKSTKAIKSTKTAKSTKTVKTTKTAKPTKTAQTRKPIREVNYSEYRLVERPNGRLELQKQEIDDAARKREKEAARREMAEMKKQKEQRLRETREIAATRVSYVRKKLARRSLFSVGLLAVALILGFLGISWAVTTKGQAPLLSAAFVVCSLILGLTAFWYGCISFLEKGRNYILARICIGISGILIISWGITIFIGVRG